MQPNGALIFFSFVSNRLYTYLTFFFQISLFIKHKVKKLRNLETINFIFLVFI